MHVTNINRLAIEGLRCIITNTELDERDPFFNGVLYGTQYYNSEAVQIM